MKLAMSNETMKRKIMEDVASGIEENCEAGTLHPEAPVNNIKSFDSAALASITTGILLVDIEVMAEVIDHIMGRSIWDHEYPIFANDFKNAVLEQFPSMPLEVGAEGWEAVREKVRTEFGATVEVVKGNPDTKEKFFKG